MAGHHLGRAHPSWSATDASRNVRDKPAVLRVLPFAMADHRLQLPARQRLAGLPKLTREVLAKLIPIEKNDASGAGRFALKVAFKIECFKYLVDGVVAVLDHCDLLAKGCVFARKLLALFK